MKAILQIEFPENCEKCPIYDDMYGYCPVVRMYCEKARVQRADFCPLMEEETQLKKCRSIEHERDIYKHRLEELRLRCFIGAEKYFDKGMYGLLKIVTIKDSIESCTTTTTPALNSELQTEN